MIRSLNGWLIGAATAISLAVGIVGTAAANEGDIAYRKAIMEALAGHLKASAAIIKGQVSHDGALSGHAHALAELAKMTTVSFPEGSGEGDSKVSPKVWSEPEAFKAVSAKFESATAAFAKAADAGDKKAAGAAFGAVVGACKACHSEFRSR